MADNNFRAGQPKPRGSKSVKRVRRPVDDASDDPMQTLVPYKNLRALAAYYCGIFSLIPGIGLLVGPAGIVLGILGYRYGQRNPTAKGTGHAVAGIVFGIIGLLLSIAIAYFVASYAFRWDGGKTIPYQQSPSTLPKPSS